MRKPHHRPLPGPRAVLAAAALAAACLLATAAPAFAADAPSTQLARNDYTALGFNVDEKVPSDLTSEPLSKDKNSRLLTKSEIYVAANGVHNNEFILRDYLADPQTISDLPTNLHNDFGAIAGAHKLWESIGDYDSDTILNYGSYGGGIRSHLSTNDASTILSSGSAGFSGLYATSVAFSWNAGSNAKDSFLAELRAFGENSKTTIEVNGKQETYSGAISIATYSFDSKGNRVHLCDLYPTVNANMMYQQGFKYIKAGYLQEYDAAFEIEAADVDGDGADELFCYAGAYQDVEVDGETIRQAIVNMFKKDGEGNWTTYEYYLDAGKTSDYSTAYTGWSNEDNDPAWGQLQSCPVVTIAAGDLDQNFKEDVAFTVSAPQNKNNVSSAACEIFTWDGSNLTRVDIDGAGGRISLGIADGKAMVSANYAFGTFAAYNAQGVKTGTTVTGLVIAGWESFDSRAHYGDDKSYDNNHPYTNAAYRYVYYDLEQGAYVISDYQSVPLEKNAKEIARRASVHNPEHKRYACTLAPFALATANLKGLEWGSEPVNEALLFGGDLYEDFACTTVEAAHPGLNMCTGHISMCADDRFNASNDRYDKSIEQVWIGDVVAGVVSDRGGTDANGNPTETFGESFLAVVGTHRNEDLRKDDDYYWMTVSHLTRIDGKNKTGEEEVICESHRRSNNTYGTYVSLALPDVDNDGVRVTYQDQYKMYTNPEVYAVLQDAPFYEDLEDSFGYLVLGGTGFGQSSSTETASTTAFDISVGASLTAAEGFIQKFEGSIAAGVGFGYEYTQSTEVGYSIAYDSHAGEGDKAVVYTLPMLCYVYDVTDEASGETEQLVAPVSLGLETSVVSLETYDEIAAAHGLTPIGEALISSTTGFPSSYETLYSSANKPYADSFGLGKSGTGNAQIDVERSYTADSTWLGVNNDTGASSTSSIEVGKSEATSQAWSPFVNVDASFGFAFLQNQALLGFVADAGMDFVSETVTSEGTEFSGTVDNLPEQAEGYSFQWQLGVNRASISDTVAGEKTDRTFWVIGYDVRNVQTPDAPAVTGFAATAATDSSVSFSWKDVLPDGSPYSYGIGILGENASDNLEVKDYRVVDGNTAEYTWEGLIPNRSYRFAIAAVTVNGNVVKPAGIRSPIVEATTMSEGTTFAVYGPDADATATDPTLLERDSSVAKQVGDALSLSAYGKIVFADGTAADELAYTWFRKLRGETEWKSLGGTHESGVSTYTASGEDNLSAEDDGAQYYCRIGYNDVAIDSGIIRVDVSEAADATQVAAGTHRKHPALKRLTHLVGEHPVSAFVPRTGYNATVNLAGNPNGGDHAPTPDPAPAPTPEPADTTSTTAASATALAGTGDTTLFLAGALIAAGTAAIAAALLALRKRQS